MQAAKRAGYPAIASILDALVDWTADSNWPVARPLAEYLITLGEPLIGPLSRVLQGSDGSRKYHVINLVVSPLPFDVLRRLEPDLRRLAEQPTADERREKADEAAREALRPLDR